MSERDLAYCIEQTILFGLLFLIYAYIAVSVIKKGDKIIIIMLIFLSLAAMSKMVEYVVFIILPESNKVGFDEMIKVTAYTFISYMFIEIAGLMNIAKWVYFILVSKVHLDIRR